MPSDKVTRRLGDILDNIARIRRYVGEDVAASLEDDRTLDAVERCLERMAEAARKIGDRFDATYPDARLGALRKFGSVLRHDYDLLDRALICNAVVHDLPVLENACRDALSRMNGLG